MKLGLGLGLSQSVGAASPANIFGNDLVCWLDASDTDTIQDTGGLVDTWVDKSTYGNDAVSATSGSRPLTNSSTLNGNNVLTWDSTSRRLILNDDSSLDNANGLAVFMVAKPTAVGAFRYLLSRYAGSGVREYQIVQRNTNTLYAQYTTDGTNGTVVGDNYTISSGTPYIAYLNNIVTDFVEFGVDTSDAQDREPESDPIYDRPTDLNITIGDRTLTGFAFEGDIAEIIMVSRGATDSEKDAVGRYLSNKWNIPYIVRDERLNIAAQGQSNLSNWWSTVSPYNEDGVNELDSVLGNSFESTFMFRGAVSGSSVHKDADTGAGHWWDTDTNSAGTNYIGFENNGVSFATGLPNTLERYDAILSICGEADATAIGNGIITKAQFKDDAFQPMLNEFIADCGSDTVILVNPLGVRNSGSDTGYQEVKEAQIETIDELNFVYFGAEQYDQPLQDSIHYTPAGYEAIAARVANRMSAIKGKRSIVGTLGGIISSATYSGSTVTATVTLDGGSPLSGSDVNVFRIEDDGSPVTINSLSIDSDEITFNLASSIGSGSVVTLYTNWGQGSSIVPANVVRDGNGLPLRTGSVNVTES